MSTRFIIDARRLTIAALLLTLPAANACTSRAEAAADSGAATMAVKVRAAGVVERPAVVHASGTVDASTTADIGFQVGGSVARVYVEEGQAVRAGQLLAMLDQTDYRLTVTQATANAVRAADEHERMKALYERGSLAPNDYAKFATNAQVTGAQAQLALEQFKDTRLVAPISGIVSRRNVDAGETVGPGAPVFSIVAIDPVEIRIGVPEAQIGMIRRGASATIAVPALAGQPFPAHVSTIGVAADAASRTYQVKLDVPNPGRQLLPGMIAEASVSGSVTMRALTVPGEAVVRDAEGATLVFVYFPNEGRVYSRRVEIGGAVDREIEITKGLTPGELVVVAGQTRVRDGSRVSATSEGAAASTSTVAGASR